MACAMRLLGFLLLLLLVLGAVTGCLQSKGDLGATGVEDGGNSPDPSRGCSIDSDCTLAAAKCCDCASFAVSAGDSLTDACGEVNCPPSSGTCANVRAACELGACVIACVPQPTTKSCANGFALDTTGCLVDECAPVLDGGCNADTDCVQTRADCCGCARGGFDTAVHANERASYDTGLGCSSSPQCPNVNTCDPAETPTCVQGRCELLAVGLPPSACGRSDLPECPSGMTCTLNANDPANMHGVGVCTTP